jgi:hypothetical protein
VPERNWHTAHARRVPLPVAPPELLEPLEPAPELAPLPLPASSDAAQPLGSSQQVAGMHVSDVEAGQSRPTSATGHSGNALLVGSCAAAGGASVNANDATRTTTKCDFICVFLPRGADLATQHVVGHAGNTMERRVDSSGRRASGIRSRHRPAHLPKSRRRCGEGSGTTFDNTVVLWRRR